MNFKAEGGDSFENRAWLAPAFERAQKSLSRLAIEIEDFENATPAFTGETIKKDKDYVLEKEKKFDLEETSESEFYRKMAVVLEAIICEQAELGDWFGEDTFTVKTSKFDDIRNGIDIVVEFENEADDGLMVLGLDVTCGSAVEKKMKTMKKHQDEGFLPNIKYYESERAEKQSLKHVPKVVVGVDKKILGEMVGLWLGGKRRELSAHSVQVEILEQIRLQLEAFSEHAQKKGKKQIAGTFRKYLNKIDVLSEKKAATISLPVGMGESEVFNSIYKNCKNFESLEY